MNATTPLAPRYTIAQRRPSSDHYMHDPGMTVLPDSTIFVAAPTLEFRAKDASHNVEENRIITNREILLSRSVDGGTTWETLPSLPYNDAIPFVHGDDLYMFLPGRELTNAFRLTKSTDKGTTWSDPVTLFNEPYWNCSTGMAIKDNMLYWGVGSAFPIEQTGMLVVRGDLSRDLMNPETWRVSNAVSFPGVPNRLRSNMLPPDQKLWPFQSPHDSWLEPNLVNVNGRLRALVRFDIDGQATSNIAAVCDLDVVDGNMDFRFTQFAALPGGQCKFFIMYDEPSTLFWMLSNAPTDSHGFFYDRDQLVNTGFMGAPGNERRILMLHYSRDAYNWFSAGCVAKWPSPIQSFMYPSAAIYNDDILFISRTSKDGQNQHDADLVTFHRIPDFRSLAMDIVPVL